LQARRRLQPAFPTPPSTSSTTRPSPQLFQVARRLGGYTQWVRSRAPTQPADSASAPGRASRPLADGLRVRARQGIAPVSRRTPRPRPAGPRAHQPADSVSAPGTLDVAVGFIDNREDPPPNFSKLPGGSEATPSGCACAPPLEASRADCHQHLLLQQSLLKPSAQLFQVARRLGGYCRGDDPRVCPRR
jgi:hypothetical protein